MKTMKKALSLCLAIAVLLSSMVFVLPSSVAATYPQELSNGSEAVSYTQSDALSGKYLVEVDVVKYSPNISVAPKAILSEAGDITLTFKPNNGTAPEQSVRFEDVIAANVFNAEGEGSFTYYAVLAGFPQKATVSVKKTNVSDNDSGIYAGLKIWNAEIGSFENIYDFSKIERSNGIGTSSLMFSNVSSLLQYYPYAKQGDATMKNLTLPAGLNATSADQTFSAVDQWGVTMVAPKFTYQPVTGLTFSQTANVMTVKGTGDANNPAANTRTVSLSATYDTLNSSVSNNFSLTKSFTVTNSSTLTFAPTYANREKAGLGVSFKTSTSNSVDKFELNSSYKMTTTNYVVLKNNSSRSARVTLSSASADKFRINPSTDTIAAGQSKQFQIIDLTAASANYNADITVSYTLDGLYDAASGTLAQLNTGATIPFIYNKTTTPDVTMEDSNTWPSYTNKVYVKYINSAGVLDKISSKADGNMSYLKANFYIDTDKYPTYQSAGLGFYAEPKNDYKDYYFQPDEGDAGYYVQRGDYESAGTFGFSTGAAASAHTSRYCEKINIKINGGKNIPFYGTIFKGSNTKDSPAEIYFDGDQDNDDGLDFLLDKGVDNSAYLNSNLYIYAYSKNSLRNTLNARGNLLSCYYNAGKWSEYTSMGSSTLKDTQIALGTDVTSQYKINQAQSAFTTAYKSILNNTANGTYSLIHNKHTGDIGTAIEETSVDYYLFETGASNVLRFKSDYADSCNKHSESAMPTLTSKGTFEHTYEYWNIDFSALVQILERYAAVAPAGQFVNESEAVGNELAAATAVDTSSASALPEKQTDVETIVNNLAAAMRNLRYTSFNMNVYHKMLDPTGKTEIDNETIQSYTDVYNKTATYGEVLDGTAVLSDGTYTVKGYHFEPQPDATFAQYASRYYYQGISSEYLCMEDKDITMVYYAKRIDSSELDSMIDEIEDTVGTWDEQYTRLSIDAFVQWYDEQDEAGELSKTYSVFEQEEYDALLAEFKEQKEKLDPIATEEQLSKIDQFIFDYESLTDFKDTFCNASQILESYVAAYEQANELQNLSESNNAGTKAAQAVLDSVENFALTPHSEGAHKLLTAPKDGFDGTYYVLCSNCGDIVDSGTLASPNFNTYRHVAYDYSNRGAALRIQDEDVQSDYQAMRFTAACKVPEDAEVTDFGFVYTQTKLLNGGVEPQDNKPVNIDQLVDGGMSVTTFSMLNGKYTVHPTDEGDVYTFNLVLNLKRANWNTHYAARSYITYVLNGVEVTVYDMTYSSRTANYIAQCVVNNPQESPTARTYLAEKFGL